MPGDGEHHCNRVFRGGDHVAEGGVHHDDTLFRGRILVDVVRPDAGPRNHLQVGRVCENLVGYFRCGPDREPIIVADHGCELVFVFAEVGLEIDVNAAVFENLNRSVREFVGDKHFGGHEWRSFF